MNKNIDLHRFGRKSTVKYLTMNREYSRVRSPSRLDQEMAAHAFLFAGKQFCLSVCTMDKLNGT
jgi:hypothetical protein